MCSAPPPRSNVLARSSAWSLRRNTPRSNVLVMCSAPPPRSDLLARSSARCWSRHFILPTCTRRPPTAPCFFLKSLFLLLFFGGISPPCLLCSSPSEPGSWQWAKCKQKTEHECAVCHSIFNVCARALCNRVWLHEVRARASKDSAPRFRRRHKFITQSSMSQIVVVTTRDL